MQNYDCMELTWDGEKSMIKVTVLVIYDKIIVSKLLPYLVKLITIRKHV